MAKPEIGTEFTELLGTVGENTAVWKSARLTESKAASRAGFVKKLGSSGATFALFPLSSHPARHPASSSGSVTSRSRLRGRDVNNCGAGVHTDVDNQQVPA